MSPVRESFGLWPADIVGKIHALERANEAGAGIDLSFEYAVPGARGIGVVGVVPGLTERRNRKPSDIAR
jgi:hypothetical protein